MPIQDRLCRLIGYAGYGKPEEKTLVFDDDENNVHPFSIQLIVFNCFCKIEPSDIRSLNRAQCPCENWASGYRTNTEYKY